MAGDNMNDDLKNIFNKANDKYKFLLNNERCLCSELKIFYKRN